MSIRAAAMIIRHVITVGLHMIRHIVFVRFSGDTRQAEREGVFADLAGLRSTVPDMLSFAGGSNISREGRSAGFTHAFMMDFADEARRDAYLAHPAHVAVANRLVSAAEADGAILVVDLDIGGS